MNLFRYHDASGDARSAALHIEKALRLYEQTGDQSSIALGKYFKLTCTLKHEKPEKAIPAFEALLEEATAQKDMAAMIRLHRNLVHQMHTAGRLDDMAKHLSALEAVAKDIPVTTEEKHFWIPILIGHGDLAQAANDPGQAISYYQKALRFSQEVPDRWLEIRCLQFLAQMEWELGNRSVAKSHIEQAYILANKLNMGDMLVYCYSVKADFAEAEGNFAEALEYTKKGFALEESLSNQGSGQNARNYFLEVEKENKELELSLRTTQLQYSIIIAVLAFLLAIGFVFGWRKQQIDKRKLTAQNNLIREQAEQLQSLDAAKSRFFANVSHELRTPLTLLLGPIQTLLKDGKLTGKQTRLLQMARQSGKQLEQLVNDILDLRKLERGLLELHVQATNLPTFVSTYAAQFESLAERKKIEFSVELPPEGTPAILLDREKFRQILFNLLANAFKFTPHDGRIGLTVSVEAGTLHLHVTDSGPGIHPDDLPHLFDRYFQTSRPDKPAEGGTGIGLALCREYALLFGGTIQVDSTLGTGSTFRVAFPVALADIGAAVMPDRAEDREAPLIGSAHQTPAASEIPDIAKPIVLVVEDNPDLQDYIRSILQEKYQVVTAGHGVEALEVLEKYRDQARVGTTSGPSPKGDVEVGAVFAASPLPSGEGPGVGLILSDLMMPVMDGYQLLEKLKSDDATRHIPVVMLTARAEVQDKLKALRIGVDDYLTKPFDEEELLARIENLLTNSAARRAAAAEESEQSISAPLLSQSDREWLEDFEAYVRGNLSSDLLSVAELTREFAMSESTLLRQLKRMTGLTPVQYLLEVRLAEARHLLETRGCDTVADVADRVGYSDARSFSRAFRARFGKLPSEV